jgi:hypothetical protein
MFKFIMVILNIISIIIIFQTLPSVAFVFAMICFYNYGKVLTKRKVEGSFLFTVAFYLPIIFVFYSVYLIFHP